MPPVLHVCEGCQSVWKVVPDTGRPFVCPRCGACYWVRPFPWEAAFLALLAALITLAWALL